MKKHNFYAGPSILSPYTIQKTADAVLNFADTGLSVLEVSHRSKEFQAVIDEAQALTKELLNLPEDYHVLFLGGGASLQFCMVPFNLLEKKAAYINTGTWATNAIKEAKIFGEVEVLASSEDTKFNYIPKDFTIPSDVDYFHFTSNNTIYGTEIRHDFDSPVPVVCDMSSDIFSREFDPTKYGLIYAGAQKNLAPSGVTIVIVKESLLGHVSRPIPTMLDYRTHIKKGSMFNTPPVLPIFSALQTLRYYKEQGGVKAMEKKDLEKAALLYDAIDSSKMFVGTVAEEDRSIMNVCFVMKPDYAELEKDFMEFATSKGIVGIKGHRSVGGFRASLYNALPIESVKVLVDAMKEFEAKH
ncbi:MAG: 3-phosphoserine/phosphohydroxythreonine transaminase [Bacteroidales bacterium]|nr:3-phosphoserine/phosphohydroxythreonine transaminase [Bacteroidales bacterium]MDE6257842.1 3-phosphoserine/phosphohydroxythreonine transaminase [Muribaculaceae bacterium]